jgi:hypothetical protein
VLLAGHASAARQLNNIISPDLSAALRDVNRQYRASIVAAHITRAAAPAAGPAAVAHATEPATRFGDDMYGHIDRRLLSPGRTTAAAAAAAAGRSAVLGSRRLAGAQAAQDNIRPSSFQMLDTQLQQRQTGTSSRIRAIVAAAAAERQPVPRGAGAVAALAAFGDDDDAAFGGRRRRLQQNAGMFGMGGMSDSLRGAAVMDRAANSVSMIRRAAAGQMAVRDAIAAAQQSP